LSYVEQLIKYLTDVKDGRVTDYQERCKYNVGRFYEVCSVLGEDKQILAHGTSLKNMSRWRYDCRTNTRKKFQNMRQEMGANMKENFTTFCRCIVDVHPYKIFH